MWITTNCDLKILRDGNTRPPYLSPEKPVCRSRKQQLELDMEQRTCSNLGKEYVKAVCCHHAYLTYSVYIMWNARLDESQAGIKIAGRNISNFRYTDNTTLMAESEEELKSLMIWMKEESEKADLKLSTQKTKITTPSPTTSWKIEREKVGIWQLLFSWAPKSLWTVTETMKLKDACSLEGKLWQSETTN